MVVRASSEMDFLPPQRFPDALLVTCRFQVAIQFKARDRNHYELGELQRFENIECQWPLFFCYLALDGMFTGNSEQVEMPETEDRIQCGCLHNGS